MALRFYFPIELISCLDHGPCEDNAELFGWFGLEQVLANGALVYDTSWRTLGPDKPIDVQLISPR